MARVLVDSSVILDVVTDDPVWGEWSTDTLLAEPAHHVAASHPTDSTLADRRPPPPVSVCVHSCQVKLQPQKHAQEPHPDHARGAPLGVG